jgi:hypothetical protein
VTGRLDLSEACAAARELGFDTLALRRHMQQVLDKFRANAGEIAKRGSSFLGVEIWLELALHN